MEQKKEVNNKVGQDQLYDLLVSRELSWQAIILDLINTERLDPWNIDLAVLAQKYVDKIRQLEQLSEGNFFISSKVLLAAAILLRIKSQILHENIRDIDELLFEDKRKLKDELVKNPQIITLDEEEIPLIMPRTPLPRARKVTLPELMSALDKAINTEHRRIKKSLSLNRARRDMGIAIFPRFTFNIAQRIKDLFSKIKDFFSRNKDDKLTFSKLIVSQDKNEKIGVFLPLIHLDHQKKVFLKQDVPFGDIDIYMKKVEDEKDLQVSGQVNEQEEFENEEELGELKEDEEEKIR
jgi:segregation and condensation protein A